MNKNADKYCLLFENLPDGFAYHQIVTDDEGIPVDYVCLEANAVFEEMTGMKREKSIGRKVTEVLPTYKGVISTGLLFMAGWL